MIDNATIHDVATGEDNQLWSVATTSSMVHTSYVTTAKVLKHIMLQVLACCIECSRCCPPDILHSAGVSAKGVTHCLGNGKHRLICSITEQQVSFHRLPMQYWLKNHWPDQAFFKHTPRTPTVFLIQRSCVIITFRC